MIEQSLNVYYRKKYLVRSFMLYLFSLLVWLGIYFIFLFQLILKKHPNVGETTHIVLSSILTLIFAAWAVKFLRVLIIDVFGRRQKPLSQPLQKA